MYGGGGSKKRSDAEGRDGVEVGSGGGEVPSKRLERLGKAVESGWVASNWMQEGSELLSRQKR